MRIAWLGAGPTDGGVGGVARLVISKLIERGHEVDCYLAGDPADLPHLSEDPRLRMFTAGSWWQWDRWYSRTQSSAFITGLAARALAQRRLTTLLLNQHRWRPYDVVYQFSNIEMFGLRRHIAELPPIVVHPETHIAGELHWFTQESALRQACEPRWRSAAIRTVLEVRSRRQQRDIQHADLVLAISESFQRHLIKDYKVQPDRLVVVPNPVDLSAFEADLHEPGSPLTIIFVGRISVRKGVEHLIDLSHRLADLGRSIQLEVIGGHALWSDYRPLLGRLNRDNTTVVGPVPADEVARRVAGADLLVQPSAYEPFGLTVAEALASGTPVVVTDVVGAGDFVEGASVIKVPPSDADALEKGVRSMIDRVRLEGPSLRQNARAEAKRAFAIDHVIERIEEALCDLAARTRSS